MIEEAAEGRVPEAPATLSLRQKVAQLVFPGAVPCHDVSSGHPAFGGAEQVREWIGRREIGGLVIFGGDAFETPMVINAWQRISRIPLLVASDFEAGAGSQIRGVTVFPSAMALGAGFSPELAHRMGRLVALEARRFGVHLILAPVADLADRADNPIVNTRAFGSDAEWVGRMAVAFARGCHEGQVLATAKHFPGHGGTDRDSHLELPQDGGQEENLRRGALVPFRALIEAEVGAVMAAHVLYPSVDPVFPASLSAKWLGQILRKELGYGGLVLTDALLMGAVRQPLTPGLKGQGRSEEEAAVAALEAGADLLLVPERPDRVIEAVVGAVEEGRLDARKVEDAANRLLAAKRRLGLFEDRFIPVAQIGDIPERETAEQLAWEVARAGTTLLRHAPGLLPFGSEQRPRFLLFVQDDPGGAKPHVFVEAMRERFGELSVVELGTAAETFPQGRGSVSVDATGVCAIFSKVRAFKGRRGLDPAIREKLRQVLASTRRTVVISFGDPFVLLELPPCSAAICTYDDAEVSQLAAVEALCGERPFLGKLPVRLSAEYPVGHGLSV